MTIVLDKVVNELTTKAVNKLVETVSENVKLVRGIESEILEMTSDIEMFNARLVDAAKNPSANELQVFRVVVKKFRNIVTEAQDAVEQYSFLKKKHRHSFVAKGWDKIPICGKINEIATEIQSIRAKVSSIRQSNEKDLKALVNYDKIIGQNSLLQSSPTTEEDSIMGFDDYFETIKSRLTGASDNYIIPIVGMPGSGKTTFARQIFEHPEIRNKFDHPIWVHVSQSFERKQKFIDILDQITKQTENYSLISDVRLKDRIKDLLMNKKYLIVMDDIWEKNHWESLRAALPAEKSDGSRVLVTTRFNRVVDSIGEPLVLKEFNVEVSWSLLEKKVFGNGGCSDASLRQLGKEIASKCNRPLAIVMIAGILRQSRAHFDWERVAKNPFVEINRRDQSYHELVMLSYNCLPNEKLRNCFLYFASLPMGHKVAAWKLIRRWVAEEFIPTIDEWGNTLELEDEAHNYLEDLVDRNLVMVMKRGADGQIKTCRIHDSLHESCKSEALRNSLFRVMEGEQRLDANAISSRRLCFHSFTANIFVEESNASHSLLSRYIRKRNPYPSSEHVHSLLFSSLPRSEILPKQKLSTSHESEIQLTKEQLATISKSFTLLRVLDIESHKISSLPDELFGLYLLRYLAITTDLKVLPKRFEKLRGLETIIVLNIEEVIALEIAGGIWNMERLRHVHTNSSTQLPSLEKGKNKCATTNLRTLSTISPKSCTEAILRRTPKLRKLGVRGNLSELLEEKEKKCLFNNISVLGCLENLKLHDTSDERLTMPIVDMFPCRLRKLAFSNTSFRWIDMGILGQLGELEVLKLDKNAFLGDRWNLKDEVVFKRLQYLRIGRTDLKTWIATEKSFPVLKCLALSNCTDLEGIPNAFANVGSLKVMELYHVSEKAVVSAKQVCEKRSVREGITELELLITSLPSKATVVNQGQGTKSVETSDVTSISFLEERIQAHAPVVVGEEGVVGFDDEAKSIETHVISGSRDLKVISIAGMAGLGKTTLAKMVFNGPRVQYEFFTRLWIHVSSAFSRRKLFLDILSSFTMMAREFYDMSEESLARKTRKILEGEKYFIVMDDVWTVDAWDCLKVVFPDNMKGSRILLTTRFYEVASYADNTGHPYQLKFLTSDESWELLEKKVFGEEKCAVLLEPMGRRIAIKCNGLPLALTMIAGVLNKDSTPDEWKEVAEDPFPIINKDNAMGYNKIIKMSYHHLPDYMKACFMYLAAFPMGYEIHAWKLIHLWIAEGFIPPSEGRYLEETAENCLNEFVHRNFLIISKRRTDGKIKTVTIISVFHDFCKREAAIENLIYELDGHGGASDSLTAHRLLSVHSYGWKDMSKIFKESNEHVQSLLSFYTDRIEIPNEELAAIPNTFPHLKVLDIGSFICSQVPKRLYSILSHLRYLAISTDLNLLPKEFENLQDLETLVFHTTRNALIVEADIWNMPKLRHLLTNTSAHLLASASSSRFDRIRKKRSSSSLSPANECSLISLSTISPSSCKTEILSKTPNLRKLGVRWSYADGHNVGTSVFEANLQVLEYLENLKLLNDGRAAGTGYRLMNRLFFPPMLRKLTLSGTQFPWDDMRIVALLPRLEVLKLEENAFTGERWEVECFIRLKFLRIGRSDLVYWEATSDSFPRLETLVIRDCTDLKGIPSDFAEIPTLTKLDLFNTSESAICSAQRIQEEQHDYGNSEFKLSIYPDKW